MQDFSNRKALDRVVRDLEKIGHVSDIIPGAWFPANAFVILDHGITRYGHLVTSRPADASYGRHSWQNVRDVGGGQHQYRNDLARVSTCCSCIADWMLTDCRNSASEINISCGMLPIASC